MTKLQGWLAVVLLLALCGLVGYGEFKPKPPTSPPLRYSIEGVPDAKFDELLRRMGDDGWSLAFARRATSDDPEVPGRSMGIYECIFTKPK